MGSLDDRWAQHRTERPDSLGNGWPGACYANLRTYNIMMLRYSYRTKVAA
jgi:hypothetical protein